MHFGLLNFDYLMGEFYISHARPEKGTFSKPAGSHDLTNSQNPCFASKGTSSIFSQSTHLMTVTAMVQPWSLRPPEYRWCSQGAPEVSLMTPIPGDLYR